MVGNLGMFGKSQIVGFSDSGLKCKREAAQAAVLY